jgi:transcriptional regulator with GAF, ATPase, and Fis domain
MGASVESVELEALLQSDGVGIAVFDRDLRFRFVNSRLALIHRVPQENHPGRTVAEVLGEKHATRLVPLLARARDGEKLVRQPYEDNPVKVVVDILPMTNGDVMVIVVETTGQRRTESELAARLRQVELVSAVSAVVTELQASDIEHEIERAMSVVGQSLAIDRVSLWRFERPQLRLHMTHEWTADGVQGTRQYSDRVVIEDSYFGSLFLDARPLIVHSSAELPPEAAVFRRQLDAVGTKALLILPMTPGGDLCGMAAYSVTTSAREWTPELLSTLRLVSEILAHACQRRRIDENLHAQLGFEQTYRQVSARLNDVSTETLDAAFASALATIGESMGFARVAVTTFSSVTEVAKVFQEWHAPDMTPYSAHREGVPTVENLGWPVSLLIAGEVVASLSADFPKEGAYAGRFLEDKRLKLHVLAPLRVMQRTVGLLIMQATKEPTSSPVEFGNRARMFADQLAATLERVRALAERQRTFDELQRLKSAIEAERDYLRQEVKGEIGQRGLLGDSAAMRRVLEAVETVAATNATTLLLGETGVGKELFARVLHERSRRANGPLVKVNCASIPKELFESEFFGHIRGAFTGALKDRAGRFELAHGGTLFLDEVGEIPLDLQTKLLRVLQEGELERIGDDKTRRVDVRIVAATNRNLARDVATGSFRQDLYYRLSVFPIRIPPLRDRREDIPLLAEHFLQLSRRELGRPELSLSKSQLGALMAYDWPGNVRELQHVVERAVILAGMTGELVFELEAEPLPAKLPNIVDKPIMTVEDMAELSRRSVLAALERSSWRIGGTGGAAELLGLRPSTLRDRMRVLKIERPR